MQGDTVLLLLSKKKHKLGCYITAHEPCLIFFVPLLDTF